MDLNTYFATICTGTDPQRRADVGACEAPTFSVYDVFRTLESIKRSSAGFHQEFWVFKRNAYILAEIVTYLFNFCLKNGRFPSATKTAKVVPLPEIKFPKTA